LKNTRFLTSAFLLSFLCVLLVSCPGEKPFDRDTRDTFNAKWQLWEEQGLRNYSFYFDFFYSDEGYSVWKGTVAVKDGAMFDYVTDNFLSDSKRFSDLKGSFQNPLLWKWLCPIPEIFENIRSESLKTSTYSIEPSDQEGVYRLYEIVISDFTLLDPEE